MIAQARSLLTDPRGSEDVSSVERKASIGFALSLLSGLLILVNGLVVALGAATVRAILGSLTFPVQFPAFVGAVITFIGILGLVLGMLVLVGAYLIRRGSLTSGGIMTLVFSLIAIFTGGGFIVGTILGAIGGVLAMAGK